MAETKSSPLDGFKVLNANTNSIKLTPLPKLSQMVSDNGMMDGLKRFDQSMEEWRQSLERNLNLLQGRAPTDLPKSQP